MENHVELFSSLDDIKWRPFFFSLQKEDFVFRNARQVGEHSCVETYFTSSLCTREKGTSPALELNIIIHNFVAPTYANVIHNTRDFMCVFISCVSQLRITHVTVGIFIYSVFSRITQCNNKKKGTITWKYVY